MDLDIDVGHHPGDRLPRGEGILADLGGGLAEDCDQRRLPGVGRADQDYLPRPLTIDRYRKTALAPSRLFRVVFQLGKPPLQIAAQVLRPLVLRDDGQHLLKRRQLLLGSLRLPEALLHLQILGGQIRRHAAPDRRPTSILNRVKSVSTSALPGRLALPFTHN